MPHNISCCSVFIRLHSLSDKRAINKWLRVLIMKITLLILSIILSVTTTMRLSKVDPNSYSEPGEPTISVSFKWQVIIFILNF